MTDEQDEVSAAEAARLFIAVGIYSDADFVTACEKVLALEEKPTVPLVGPLVKKYYEMPGNGSGGSLHVVLDDNNVEDAFVSSSIEWAERNNDPCGAALAKVLLRMSKTQRYKLARDFARA